VVTDDPGGEGREIARELVVCPTCAKTSDDATADSPVVATRAPPRGAVA